MRNIFQNFYRNFYMRTGGFIPSKPLTQNIYPGDFFQIKSGEMVTLGNIFRNGLINGDDIQISNGARINSQAWRFSDGVTKPYSGRGTGNLATGGEFEFSKQVLAFNNAGSFYFAGHSAESVRITNWNDIQQQLIIKLTQVYYSFREVYVVTESAATAQWTLAIAGGEGAELEIATDAENFGLADIFGHESAKTIQSKNIEYYHQEAGRKPVFFKAKKLVVQEEQAEVFISEHINQSQLQNEWVNRFFEYEFKHDQNSTGSYQSNLHVSALDMLRANELNPNTALTYFKWADANLDDVERMFLSYGV